MAANEMSTKTKVVMPITKDLIDARCIDPSVGGSFM